MQGPRQTAQPQKFEKVVAGWSGGALSTIAHVLEPASMCSVGCTELAAQFELGNNSAPQVRATTAAAEQGQQMEAFVSRAVAVGHQSERARQEVVLHSSRGAVQSPQRGTSGVGRGWVIATPLNNFCKEQR